MKLFSSRADLEWVFIDETHVRADQHATGIKNQAISKSIGGNSSKINLAIDANGNPIEFIISDGTTHDVKVAPDLIERIPLEATKIVCADKEYDSEEFRKQIRESGAQANIPKKGNNKSNNDNMDCYVFKIKHLVENSFTRLKHFRGVATRFDKLKSNYAGAVALAYIHLVAIMKCQQTLIWPI